MACVSGTKIVDDGLLFHYDMDNVEKSWIGAPATNELIGNGWAGDGADQTYFTKGFVEVTDPKLKYRNLDTILWSPGTSLNVYLNGTPDLNYSSNSTEWTFATFIKREDGKPITSLNVYMYYPNSDGSGNGVIQDMGDGWYRVHRTRTGASSYISLVGFTGFSSNVKYYLAGPMLTKTQYPVYPTDINTTRSNTEALIDLTGSETITAQSLTYNSDGTFTMSSGDYLTLSNDCPTIFGTGSVSATIEMWVKPQVTHNKVFCGQQNTTNERLYLGAYNNLWDFGWGGAAWDSGVYTGTRPSCVANVWQHVVLSIDAGVASLYKNGAFAASKTDTTVIMTGTFPIGTYYSGGVKNNSYDSAKDITDFKIYNKALSAKEVKQNYEALRGRFSL